MVGPLSHSNINVNFNFSAVYNEYTFISYTTTLLAAIIHNRVAAAAVAAAVAVAAAANSHRVMCIENLDCCVHKCKLLCKA